MSKIKIERKTNEFYNNERTTILRDWCNAVRGRATALSKEVLITKTGTWHNSMSHYKSGKHQISDKMWKKIKKGMDKVEKIENDLKLKKVPLNGRPLQSTHAIKSQEVDKTLNKKSNNKSKVNPSVKIKIHGNEIFIQKDVKLDSKYKIIEMLNEYFMYTQLRFQKLFNLVYSHNIGVSYDDHFSFFKNNPERIDEFYKQLNLIVEKCNSLIINKSEVYKMIKEKCKNITHS